MILSLAFLFAWDFCPGEVPFAYRVEYAHRYVVSPVPGVDDDGNIVAMPIYNPWQRIFVQLGPEMQAQVPCEPKAGEVCVAIVTSLDVWGLEDSGGECS